MFWAVNFKVSNFKKIVAAEIDLNKNETVISGKNRQGKSALCDGFSVLLDGKKAGVSLDEPVRKGAKKAVLEGTLVDSWDSKDGEIKIKRTISAKGNWTLNISAKGATSTESWLREKFGKPVNANAFAEMTEAKQLEALKDYAKIDFTALNKEHKEAYQERAIVNREGKRLKGLVDSMDYFPDATGDIQTVSELAVELDKRRQNNQECDGLTSSISFLQKTIEGASDKIIELNRQIKKIEGENESNTAKLKEIEEALKHRRYADEQEIIDQIGNLETVNNQIRSNQAKAEAENNLAEKRKESKKFSDRLKAIEQEKKEALSSARFPVPGISFDDEKGIVLYNDIPFSQASAEEKITISFAMLLADDPELRTMVIKDGCAYDDMQKQKLFDLAKRHKVQLIFEEHGTGGDVVIENGVIV